MEIKYNVSLKPFNTFGFDASADVMVRAFSESDVAETAGMTVGMGLPLKVMGGGSNVLITSRQQSLILKMEIGGISADSISNDEVIVTAGGGCDWEELIDFAVAHRLWGIENLTLIPGKVGSSPIQNIGAYGVELKDVFYSLRAYDTADNKFVGLGPADCDFGYRDSLFKGAGRNRYVITSVSVKLSARPLPKLHYGRIAEALQQKGVVAPEPADIVETIREIRRSKLPDTSSVGSAGSFFKNPVINAADAQRILSEFPSAPVFPVNDSLSKIAAGWLIEQCGWRGFRRGDAGVWPHQALVLVNYGNACAHEIVALAHEIISSVKEKFGLVLDPEVNIW